MTKNLFKQIHPFDFFLLVCAFFYGNIFTIQFSTLDWGFVLILSMVLFIEMVDRFIYFAFHQNQKKLQTLNNEFGTKDEIVANTSLMCPFFLLNTLKRGFLLGFFVEAFKVGS